MKKRFFTEIFTLLIGLNFYISASFPIEYWKAQTPMTDKDSDKKEYTILALDFIGQACKDVAPEDTMHYLYQVTADEMKADYVTAKIPALMVKNRQRKIAKPVHLKAPKIKNIYWNWAEQAKVDFNIKAEITSGEIYENFQEIIKKHLELIDVSIRLYDEELDGNATASADLDSVILYPRFYEEVDAYKLFALYHELGHIIHNDPLDRQYNRIYKNKNQITDLAQTPGLQLFLQENKVYTQKEIDRFQEFAADAHALELMQCPYCLYEVALIKGNYFLPAGTYALEGYLAIWQYEERFRELLDQKTICKHHCCNGKMVDLDVKDGSSVKDRLIITKDMIDQKGSFAQDKIVVMQHEGKSFQTRCVFERSRDMK